MSPKILVVDDEPTLTETIKYNLLREGHEVMVAHDGVQALEMARQIKPDLIVLDIMLPRLSGLDVCRTLRRETIVPILMLTAKDEEIDKVVGLEIGADDYMTKPFSMRELLARVGALLRRMRMTQGEASAEKSETPRRAMVAGDLEIDLASHVASRQGTVLALKPKEFDLLTYLVRNRGLVLTREQILEQVWGYEYVGDMRTVDVHVRWLREKIEQDPGKPTRIQTIRNVGYKFEG
ncbi:MAG: response regulator transcription factor [Chloroflexota bacterium]|nr:MAG: response regulator transcription factor [Chloroflexota bacterium]